MALDNVNLAYDYLCLNRPDEAKAILERALKLNPDFPPLHKGMYYVAFLQKNAHAMQQQVAWAVGKPYAEPMLLSAQAETAAYFGHLHEDRELSGRAVNAYKRNGASETAALRQAEAALRESEVGNSAQAIAAATAALVLAPGRDVRLRAALALAWAGDAAKARSLESKLNKEFPLDTIIQNYWLPTVRTQIEINHGNAGHAINLLQAASFYEMSSDGFMSSVYVRGQAYLLAHRGKEAAAEFQKVLDHPGLTLYSPLAPLAHLGLARAYALSGDASKVRTAYQDFLALWKDADPDLSILREAKAEYAKLQ